MNRKKICHVTTVHPQFDERIFYKECISLSKLYDVIIVATNAEEIVSDGVSFKNITLPKSRILRMLRMKKLLKTLISIDALLYHFHDPELIGVGRKMKKLGKHVVFDSHEDVPMQIIAKNSIPVFLRKPFSYVYRIYEKHCLKKYDAIVTVTPSIVERLTNINPNTYQVTNYPIYIDFIDNRKWDNSIVFAGGISDQWMHKNIIDSLTNLDVKYRLAGRADENYLNELKHNDNWGKVEFLGLINHKEVQNFIQQSTAGIALNDYVPNVGYKMGSLGNTKLFEYMMAGVPVIATDFKLWKDIVEGNECGICVNPHNTISIREAIETIVSNKEKAKKMGDNGQKAIKEQYNWGSQEIILFEMYNKILNK